MSLPAVAPPSSIGFDTGHLDEFLWDHVHGLCGSLRLTRFTYFAHSRKRWARDAVLKQSRVAFARPALAIVEGRAPDLTPIPFE